MSILRIVTCAIVLAGSGAAHGILTHRWRAAADFTPVQSRLEAVGRQFGAWTATDVRMSADELDRVSIRAHLSREYRNGQTGRVVRLLVVAGPPGPISVHTPDVCFQGTGFEQKTPPEAVAVGGGGARLWGASFAKPGPVPTQLRVYWGWYGGAGWEAPEHRTARYKFAFRPILYKVYLVADDDRLGAAGRTAPAEEIAALLLPELERAISVQP